MMMGTVKKCLGTRVLNRTLMGAVGARTGGGRSGNGGGDKCMVMKAWM